MKLRAFLGRKRRKYKNERILKQYINKFKRFSADSNYSINNGRYAERSILIQTHVIEKGLQHKVLKPLFGYKRISTISNSLNDYLKHGGKNSYVVGTAISALHEYNEVNRKFENVNDSQLIPEPKVDLQNCDITVGTIEVTRDEFFKGSDLDFSEFCKSRHSLRMYDCTSNKISYDNLLQCIKIAQLCPNACNRQAVRVKVVLDSEKIKEITRIQGGADGFGEKSGAMLIITSDISMYTMSEHNLSMIDCGIFILNLVYALYERKLGSCVLNCSMTAEEEARLMRIVPVSDSEIYAAIISVVNIPENETVKVAKSEKRPIDDIVQLI
ncbi:MAG: hypothetical protein K6E27_04180 [Eubacterium sp.]|nr:hypothetical protein [Eubacterium sp.]